MRSCNVNILCVGSKMRRIGDESFTSKTKEIKQDSFRLYCNSNPAD